jgi:hypothetical protein
MALAASSFDAFEFHRDHVPAVPPNCELTATSEGCVVEAFCHKTLPVYGVQFHPEIAAQQCRTILGNWQSEQKEPPAVVGHPESFDSTLALCIFEAYLAAWNRSFDEAAELTCNKGNCQ